MASGLAQCPMPPSGATLVPTRSVTYSNHGSSIFRISNDMDSETYVLLKDCRHSLHQQVLMAAVPCVLTAKIQLPVTGKWLALFSNAHFQLIQTASRKT